jgi:hypothetical protein
MPPIVHPKPGRPVAMAAYFDIGRRADDYPGLRMLEKAVRQSGVTSRAPFYIGSYGPNRDVADALRGLGARYAPLFTIQPGRPKASTAYVPAPFYRERGAADMLSDDELADLDPAYATRIPLAAPGVPLPAVDQAGWGLELGRRYRDAIRRARSHGLIIDTWQFDEILLEVEVGAPPARQQLYRAFIGGILQGLLEGRKEFGDQDERGIVWHALQRQPLRSKPLPLLHATKTPGLSTFWEILDRASWRVVGQEYTRFDGRPELQADTWALFQQLLQRPKPLGGDIRRSIGAKYVVGMSPGYHSDTRRLGGRVTPTWTRAQVNAWRKKYLRRRPAVVHPSGYAQFNFTAGNAAFEPTLDALKALDFGLSVTAH